MPSPGSDLQEREEDLKLALPKGRMQAGIFSLFSDAGIEIRLGSRGYRPQVSLEGIDAKILKPQNVVEMLDSGTRDVGFAGADWVRELNADVLEILDTGLDRVRLVAAAPASMVRGGRLTKTAAVVASEYERIARQWISDRNPGARFVRSYGATEVFPPEDADCILDITASGDTLRAQGLAEFDVIMQSSTRLYASKKALDKPRTRDAIDHLAMLLRSVLEARGRVMLEVNVSRDSLARVASVLPCMREPTISPLRADTGFAVKAAVLRELLPTLIPKIKSLGGTDIVVSQLSQIIP